MIDWIEIGKRYPMPAGADTLRPWWSGDGYRVITRRDGCTVEPFGDGSLLVVRPQRGETGPHDWERIVLDYPSGNTDRHQGVDRAMAETDALHPLPAPKPACGQVWSIDGEEQVVAVVRKTGDSWYVRWSGHESAICSGRWRGWAWPPPGAALIAGPQSPWMDTRGEP